MVLKPKSREPVKPVKPGSSFSPWSLPELRSDGKPGFQQPVESVDEAEDKAPGAEELQAIRDAARKEGYDAGLKQGLKAAQQQVNQQSKLFTDICSQLSEPARYCEEQTQRQLLELAFAVARQIIRRELQQDPTQLVAVIRDAIKLLPVGTQKVEILLHPEDANIVQNALSIDTQAESSRWQIKHDPSLARGGCQLVSKNSKVDASIDKQIAVLFSRVAGGLRAGETNGTNPETGALEAENKMAADNSADTHIDNGDLPSAE